MSAFCFIVTEKCDWKCDYCDFVSIEEPKSTSVKILKKHLPYVSEVLKKIGDYVVHIDIAGGEVGLLPLDVLQYFFKTLDFPLVVSTNGKFLERGYHKDPIIRPYIKEIQWHVYPHPKGVKIDVDYEDPVIFINKGIVGDNADDMVAFCEANPNIRLNYVDFEFPTDKPRKMDYHTYQDLYDKIKDVPNITDNAKNIVLGRLSERDNLRSLCEKFNQTAVIDLANEDIMFCHRSQNVTIPLNRENLIRRIQKFPKDIFVGDKRCNACTRLYAGKMCGNEIETFFKTRTIKL